MKSSIANMRIAFDNGGGATLFGRQFAHNYQDGKQLAADVICLLAGGNPATWDGDDAELRVAMRKENMDNYEAVYTIQNVADALSYGHIVVEEERVKVLTFGGHNAHNGVSGHTEADFWRNVSAR